MEPEFLGRQRTASMSPSERLGDRLNDESDEGQDVLVQVIDRGESGAFQ